MVPEVSEEARLKILEKLPECIDFAKELVATMKAQQENIAKHNTDITQNIIASLNAVQKSLESMGNKPDLTFEERKYFCDKQMEIAQMYIALNSTNKDFLQKLWKGVSTFGIVALFVIASVVGVRFLGGKGNKG